MILRNDFNSQRNATYEATITNLEKAKDILNEKLEKKLISNEEYIKKVKEIEAQIAKYKQVIGRDY